MGWVVASSPLVFLGAVTYQMEWYTASGRPRAELLVRFQSLQDGSSRQYLTEHDDLERTANPGEEVPDTLKTTRESPQQIAAPMERQTLEHTGVDAKGPATTVSAKPPQDQNAPMSTEKPSESAVSTEKRPEQDPLQVSSQAGVSSLTTTTTTDEAVREGLLVLLVALALEHARACGVAYALLDVQEDYMVSFFQTYFRMKLRPSDDGVRTLVCNFT